MDVTLQSSQNVAKLVLIVAIDFGTTYSGICFAQSDDVEQQYLVTVWPSAGEKRLESDKVPTRISYSTDHKALKWGFEVEETERRYQEFKLHLDTDRKPNQSAIAQRYKDPLGLIFTPPFKPTRLSIDFLKQLRKCLEDSVDNLMGQGTLESMSVQYVITVPAIWSDNGKDLTMFCAQNAGLGNPKLISEPEAAMVHALQNMSADDFAVGDTFVVCDAGGGTVDLITYKVTSVEPLEVEEVVAGDGDRCGSAFITRRFRKYIEENYTKLPFWTEKHTTRAVEAFELRAKRKFDDKDTEVIVKIQDVPDYNKKNIKIKKHKIFIPSATIKAMFDEVVPTVFGLIKEQRQRAAKKGVPINGVILVGGFCESPYLKQYLTRNLQSIDKKIKIIEPKHGWSAIVRGALSRALPIVGRNQIVPRITSRVARLYYGITDSRIFNPRTDPPNKKFTVESDGKEYIERIHWFLAKGATVKENYETIRNYEHSWPCDSNDPRDTTIRLKIVSWNPHDEKDISIPLYPDTPGVEIVNNLNVNLRVIPVDDLQGRQHDRKMYYLCYPDVHITYHFATIQYQLYIDNKCYGEVQSGIET